jgi:integrase
MQPSGPNKCRSTDRLTWEHPIGSGIKIAEIPNKSAGILFGTSFQVRVPARLLGQVGKREILQRSTRAEAEQLAEDRFIALKKHGTEFSKIPAKMQKQAALAWGMLEEHNAKTRLDLEFIDVVRAGLSALSPSGGQRTFAEVAAELRDSKAQRWQAGGLDVQTERGFRKRSELLEATPLGKKLVSEITAAEISKVLTGLGTKYSQRSILNYRNILSEVLRHAKARGYTPHNPLDGFAREDFKKLGGIKPERELDGINILTVKETRRLLDAALASNETGMLATLVLRLFCGVRSKEVSLLDWSEVHWLDPKPYVHISAGKAKKRRIRHIEITPNALEWLKACNPPAVGRIDPKSPKTYAKRFGRISRAAEIGSTDAKGRWHSDWEFNDTRHSFGSYHFALHEDSTYTAGQLGHKSNDDILFAHYRSLVHKKDAEQYFSLRPLARANITKFPRAISGS